MMTGFPLVDRYIGTRLGADLSAFGNEGVAVVESPRRLRREQSYGFIHALWWFWLTDGRSVASVPPGAGEAIGEALREVRTAEQLSDQTLVARLRSSVDAALLAAGLPATDRVRCSLWFACNAAHLRRHPGESCRRLTDEGVPPAEELRLPVHCFPEGIVCGAVTDGRVVSVAYAHRSGFMEDEVADLGVETALAYADAAVPALWYLPLSSISRAQEVRRFTAVCPTTWRLRPPRVAWALCLMGPAWRCARRRIPLKPCCASSMRRK